MNISARNWHLSISALALDDVAITRIRFLYVCGLYVSHKLEFYRNGWTNQVSFRHRSLLLPVLHCVERKFAYIQKYWDFPVERRPKLRTFENFATAYRSSNVLSTWSQMAWKHVYARQHSVTVDEVSACVMWLYGGRKHASWKISPGPCTGAWSGTPRSPDNNKLIHSILTMRMPAMNAHIQLTLLAVHMCSVTDQFSGPGRAIGPSWLRVCCLQNSRQTK